MSGFNAKRVKYYNTMSIKYKYIESVAIYGKNDEILNKVDIYIDLTTDRSENILIVYGNANNEYIITSLHILAGYYMVAHNTEHIKSFFSDELEFMVK